MNVLQEWTGIIQELACKTFALDSEAVARITVEFPKDPTHGHLSTNVAMVLAKPLQQKPLDLAHKVCAALKNNDLVASAEPAGPGFINLRLKNTYWDHVLEHVLDTYSFGFSEIGKGQVANIEYVSCNPTGPMHIGHSRGAIVGDVLANLYKALGYTVVKEFYCNDAGAQIQALAKSVYKRYCHNYGHDYAEDVAYPGDYLQPVADALGNTYGNQWVDKAESEWSDVFRAQAVSMMMQCIQEDLAKLGVQHDVITSEKSLIDRKLVDNTIQEMHAQGLLYQGVLPQPKGHNDLDWEPREQLLFKSTDYGDDTDRALMRSDGHYTYFASDIAYHKDKIQRGADILIDVWGADHAGYIKRMQAAVKAVSRDQRQLNVLVCQMVKFMSQGEAVTMSKRAGTFISVDDVLSEVGKDVVRFVMLTRRNDAPLDFDFEKVVEQSRENPVFYVHYAHARICSVLRHAVNIFGNEKLSSELFQKNRSYDFDEEDYQLIRLLSGWPRTVELAALACEPHRIAFYLCEVAAALHSLWTKGKDDVDLRFIHSDNWEKTKQRLMLLKAVQIVLQKGFDIMGIEPLEELH